MEITDPNPVSINVQGFSILGFNTVTIPPLSAQQSRNYLYLEGRHTSQ